MDVPSPRFKKGDPKPPTSGRKKGVRNKIPRELRQLVQDTLVDAGKGGDAEERARNYLVRLARKRNPALFVALLGKTIEQHVKVSADTRETVRIINLSNVDISDPEVRKRLGPSILGGPVKEEKGGEGD